VQTTITGLIHTPFTLTGEYAQTYVPGHHNFFEWFLFEPRLDQGLSQETLDELRAQGVDLISTTTGSNDSTIVTYDLVKETPPVENCDEPNADDVSLYVGLGWEL